VWEAPSLPVVSHGAQVRGRGPGAAAAELAELTVLHVDKGFELIAEITGQPMERLGTA
jgi:hypothetical protein